MKLAGFLFLAVGVLAHGQSVTLQPGQSIGVTTSPGLWHTIWHSLVLGWAGIIGWESGKYIFRRYAAPPTREGK